MNFEVAYKKLESITMQLENEPESLELSMKLYREAKKLSDYCEKLIFEAEQEIILLEEKS